MAVPLEPIIKLVQQEVVSNNSQYVSLQNVELNSEEETGKNDNVHYMHGPKLILA